MISAAPSFDPRNTTEVVSRLLNTWVMRTGSTFVGGATPFIQGLVSAARAAGIAAEDVPLLRGNCGSADAMAPHDWQTTCRWGCSAAW